MCSNRMTMLIIFSDVLIKVKTFVDVCRQQHSLHRGSGPAESPAAHGQPGRLGLPGGAGGGGGPPLRRAAALLQHTLPAVHRTAGGRGSGPQRQVSGGAWFVVARLPGSTPGARRSPEPILVLPAGLLLPRSAFSRQITVSLLKRFMKTEGEPALRVTGDDEVFFSEQTSSIQAKTARCG